MSKQNPARLLGLPSNPALTERLRHEHRKPVPSPSAHAFLLRPAVELAFDPIVRDAERLQVGKHRLEEARLRLGAGFLCRGDVELRDARPAHVDVALGRLRNRLAQQRQADPPLPHVGPNAAGFSSRVRLWMIVRRSGFAAASLASSSRKMTSAHILFE